ncbi:hypothetical protein CkaCkLH20_03867 [Colletotrichum karsti]|uniref:BTB domain-containing protein n=1 Tax=Colletotrichum karsti TaxID=1095194 RepID=A0A9P6I9B9_9PEZI|nr:uncharacterized protein CkaCkLH20_03867 [Colletotrichum karsti]KAF9878375.1 hypothetical protein CkaCkLH20_03867 [Colletotrichum karsti]
MEPSAKRIRLNNDKDETVVVDQDGDLRLRVGSAPNRVATFVICSKTVGRVSPVFKRMLFGNFAEARPANDEEWVVELPDDDSNTFEIYLNIIHGWFDKVPNKLNVRKLASLLTVADKYDSTPCCSHGLGNG